MNENNKEKYINYALGTAAFVAGALMAAGIVFELKGIDPFSN